MFFLNPLSKFVAQLVKVSPSGLCCAKRQRFKPRPDHNFLLVLSTSTLQRSIAYGDGQVDKKFSQLKKNLHSLFLQFFSNNLNTFSGEVIIEVRFR